MLELILGDVCFCCVVHLWLVGLDKPVDVLRLLVGPLRVVERSEVGITVEAIVDFVPLALCVVHATLVAAVGHIENGKWASQFYLAHPPNDPKPNPKS